MKTKKSGYNLLLLLILCSFPMTFAHAGDAVKIQKSQKGVVGIHNTKFVFTDPAVLSITSTACSCELPAILDALVMAGGVRTALYNHGTLKATIQLKLTWYDLTTGRIKTRLKNTTIEGRQYKTVTMHPVPILAKKSVGITVEIISVNPRDKNTTNNKITTKRCDTHIVQ